MFLGRFISVNQHGDETMSFFDKVSHAIADNALDECCIPYQ